MNIYKDEYFWMQISSNYVISQWTLHQILLLVWATVVLIVKIITFDVRWLKHFMYVKVLVGSLQEDLGDLGPTWANMPD